MSRPVAECGTYAGYQRHLRLKTSTCSPCRAAVAECRRNQRAARAASRPVTAPAPRLALPPLSHHRELPPASPRPSLTKAELDALCGGAPTAMVPCPRADCVRELGPYYAADSQQARAALADHLHIAHAAVFVSMGATW
jgi:hypothetical protein